MKAKSSPIDPILTLAFSRRERACDDLLKIVHEYPFNSTLPLFRDWRSSPCAEGVYQGKWASKAPLFWISDL